MQFDVVDVLILPILVFFSELVREDVFPESENAVRDHNIRGVFAVLEEIILQSSDSIRDHDNFAQPLRHLNDHILGLARDETSRRGKIGIVLIHLKGRDVHHAEGFFSYMPHVWSDAHRLDERIFFLPEPEQHVFPESGISD